MKVQCQEREKSIRKLFWSISSIICLKNMKNSERCWLTPNKLNKTRLNISLVLEMKELNDDFYELFYAIFGSNWEILRNQYHKWLSTSGWVEGVESFVHFFFSAFSIVGANSIGVSHHSSVVSLATGTSNQAFLSIFFWDAFSIFICYSSIVMIKLFHLLFEFKWFLFLMF